MWMPFCTLCLLDVTNGAPFKKPFKDTPPSKDSKLKYNCNILEHVLPGTTPGGAHPTESQSSTLASKIEKGLVIDKH